MSKTVKNNYTIYAVFDDEVGNAIYTVFNSKDDTVTTIYNKNELNKYIGE